MKHYARLTVLFFFSFLFLQVTQAADCDRSVDGGGGVPIPFSSMNQKVELASGENYALVGWVRSIGDQFFFEVDLKEHAWLANKLRSAQPYYPLYSPDGMGKLSRFGDMKVQVYAVAKAQVITTQSGVFLYQIALSLLNEPELKK